MELKNYLHLYLGCNTTMGKLVGVKQNSCFTQLLTGEIIETGFTDKVFPVKPILRRMREMTEEESIELIKRGLSIGRPKGYSFSPDALSFLLSNQIDLFGLIDKGLAISEDDYPLHTK